MTLPSRSTGRFPARTQRPAPGRTALTESTSNRRGNLMTEANADFHKAQIIREGKKNALVNKWSSVLGKCRDVTPSKFSLMAAMLENQMTCWSPKNRTIFEDQTTTANIADFTRFALPLIRKSYPRLIADNLVGVQPMSQPASLIFYIRYKYALTKGQTQAGTQIMRQNTAQGFNRQNGWALDPYYSSQTVKAETAAITGQNTVTATLAHRPVLAGTVVVEVFSNEEDASPNCHDAIPCIRVTFDPDGDPDGVIVGDCTDFTNTIEVDTTTPNATKFNHTTGAVQVRLSAGHYPASAVARVHYEYDLESNPFQPEVTMEIDSDSVSATSRKLKTSWSLEAAQDLKSIHNIDAESTLTDLMADEMVAEIDREIINDLIVSAYIRAEHNFATAAGASVNFTDRNIALAYKTLEVANIIHRSTLRGPANWMVTSSDICSKFEQLNDFRANDAFTTEGVDIGITNSGSLSSKMKIYKDPLFPNCKVLLGFKGNNVLDSGYFYAPYVPLLSTPTVLDPNSHSPSKGVSTRYGKKLIEDGGLYYATINVSNL